jgi:hypothetical protein
MKTSFQGFSIAKSSTGFYVGRFFQEDEAITQFVRLTDDFSSNQEAIEWIYTKCKKTIRFICARWKC